VIDAGLENREGGRVNLMLSVKIKLLEQKVSNVFFLRAGCVNVLIAGIGRLSLHSFGRPEMYGFYFHGVAEPSSFLWNYAELGAIRWFELVQSCNHRDLR